MNKKLVKTRIARMNTLEAMVCKCGCPSCLPTNCSGGGAFMAVEEAKKNSNNFRNATLYYKK